MSADAVAVVAVAGGCGASTLAGALALHRARSGASAWLLELDLDRGDLADAWDVSSERTIADLGPVADELDAGHLGCAAQAHDGVNVILAPPTAEGVGAWTPDALGRLVAAARAAAGPGGRVMADAGCGPSARATAVGAAADRVLLVCPATIGGARRARRMADAFGAGGCALVVAGPGDRELGSRPLGRAAGVPVVAEIPWAPGEAARLAAGRWPSGRRAKLAAAIGALAEALT